MNKLNGNILVGSAHSKARCVYSKNYCLDCIPVDGDKGKYYEYELSLADYCEVCEKPKGKIKNNILVTNIREF